MIVYRTCREKRKSDLSGVGAMIAGGRWNKKGIKVVYASESKDVAKKELQRGPTGKLIPPGYVYVHIEIPDDIDILEVTREMLSDVVWDKTPYAGLASQIIGSELLSENQYAVIKVPSVVNDTDYNLLINPNHPDVKKITIIKDSVLK